MKNVTKLIFFASLITLLFTIGCMDENYAQENLKSNQTIGTNQVNESNETTNRCNIIFKENKIVPATNLLRGTNFTDRIAKARFIEDLKKNSIKQINKVLISNGIDSVRVLNYYTTTISGITIELNKTEMAKLSRDENVELIEFDKTLQLPKFEVTDSSPLIN